MQLKEFQNNLKDKNIDTAIFLTYSMDFVDPNFFYFTQLDIDFGCLVIQQKGKPLLFVSRHEYKRARKECRRIKVISLPKNKDFFKFLYGKISTDNIKKIGIDKRALSVSNFAKIKKHFKKIRFFDIGPDCLSLRQIKTDEEIKIIRNGCRISDKILAECFDNFKMFRSELDVATFLKREALKYNCNTSFPVIVASGRNAFYCHHKPNRQKLRKGFCVIDFGIRYKGYCTDTTRTVRIGKPNQKEKKLYDKILSLQEKLIGNIRVGQKESDLFRIAKRNLGRNFSHGLGHGIGINIHEMPNISDKGTGRLQEKMVFTIEPGIYFENKLGIRLEDDVVLTKKGCRILTKIPKRLIFF